MGRIEDPPINSAFEKEIREGKWIGWPKIWKVAYGCEANFGRGLIAEIITNQGISKGELTPFFVSSGSLVTRYNGRYPGFHPLTKAEIEKRKGRPLYSFEGLQNASKPLKDCYINGDTDVILFVPEWMIEVYLDDHLGSNNVRPRSIICYPFDDASNPSNGLTPEEAMSITYNKMEHFVYHDLKGIISMVRRGEYNNPEHRHNGIYYPLGFNREEYLKQRHPSLEIAPK